MGSAAWASKPLLRSLMLACATTILVPDVLPREPMFLSSVPLPHQNGPGDQAAGNALLAGVAGCEAEPPAQRSGAARRLTKHPPLRGGRCPLLQSLISPQCQRSAHEPARSARLSADAAGFEAKRRSIRLGVQPAADRALHAPCAKAPEQTNSEGPLLRQRGIRPPAASLLLRFRHRRRARVALLPNGLEAFQKAVEIQLDSFVGHDRGHAIGQGHQARLRLPNIPQQPNRIEIGIDVLQAKLRLLERPRIVQKGGSDRSAAPCIGWASTRRPVRSLKPARAAAAAWV